MKSSTPASVIVACLLTCAIGRAQADKVFLRLEPGGPTSVLNAVAFSPDGTRIYAAGYDKVVRVWSLDPKQGAFGLSNIAYRVPVGPGLEGTINALAASPDGRWLAVGGYGLMRGRADFRTVGMVFPALGAKSKEMLEDQGTIYVFDVNNERSVRALRGHAGTVLSLAFLPARDGKPALLVSAAEEPTGKADEYAAVVRLWDAVSGAALAEQAIDTKAPHRSPGLAAWHTGPGPKDVAAAVAWSDGQLRVWDAASGRVSTAPDGKVNNTAAAVGDGRFVTAGFVSPDGAVRTWQGGVGREPQRITQSEVMLEPEDRRTGPFLVPRDLAAFPSRPGGAIDRAVVVARRQGVKASSDDPDVLLLLDLADNRVLGRRTLGPFQLNLRRVAASPTGKYVAIADADEQRVLVFSTDELTGGKAEARPQELQSVGVSFKAAEFRKKGDDPGLFLRDAAGARMIFDFNGRRLLADDDGWKKDAADVSGWKLEQQTRDGRAVLSVSGPDFDAKTITLGENCVPTSVALSPPRKGRPFGPVLAVGWLDEYRQSMLALYDVASGVQVRQLAGHVAAVRSLAFSGDGRLLASAADDQTVCLWGMTDLGDVFGKVGALPGVAVVQKGDDVEVAAAPDEGPLKVGARVEGLVEDEKVRALATPRDFYTVFFNAKPKTKAVLRMRPPGADKATDVTVQVGQGADEHKPLLNIFITRDGDPVKRQWIAWTSMGPYDASSRRAEDYLGWHFNPEKPGAPVDFARADKYRADYESQGILKHLIRLADPVKALEDWKNEPAPDMEMSIDGVDPQGPRVVDRPLVRARALTLRVELPRAFPLERVSAAQWRMDDGPWQPLGEPHDRSWSADLSRLDWGRGPHTVAARLDTDGGRRRLDQTAAFHYLPERPRIEFARDWLEKHFPGSTAAVPETTVKQAAFDLEAQVRPATTGEAVRVTLRTAGAEPTAVDGGDVRHDFTLQDGDNVIEIRAVNAGAAPGLEAEETAVRRVKVRFYPERPAPQIAVRTVTPLTDGAAPIPAAPGGKFEVTSPKIRVVGRMAGDADLQSATRDGRQLGGFEPDKVKQFDFDDEVVLKPGEQTLRYEAKSENSPAAVETVQLVYRPRTAAILAVRPVDQSKGYEKEVELRAELAPADDPAPCAAQVLVNDRPQGKPQQLTGGDRLFKQRIALDPGANRVVLKLTNDWGASALRELQLRYLRPPHVMKLDAPERVERAVLDLTAEVESPADLPPCEARLNGALFRDDRLDVKLLDRDKGLWRLTLRDVGLKEEGDNALTLRVANRDDLGPDAAEAHVRYDRPKPPAPVVRFRDFRGGEHYDVASPQQPLAFSVESTTPLKRVELRGEGDAVLFQGKADALKVEEEPTVRLRPAKPTTFRLVAVNDGGEVETNVTLQLPERPAYVVIDNLEPMRQGSKPFLPLSDRNDGEGRAVFGTVSDGRVVLHGRILWNDPNDERFRGQIQVRVYANGFQQIPAEAQPTPAGATEVPFTAIVLLTRAENNVIEVDLPDLKRADGQRNACVVRKCTEPISGRRLHLVVVGIDENDGDALKQRALGAVGARRAAGADGRLEAPPAFEEVIAYDPLVGGVSKGQFLHRLKGVKRQIHAAAPEDQNVPLSDVVLVYYQGRETATPSGCYLLSDDSQGDEDLDRTALSCSEIVDLFGDAPGAQVMMLDTERVARAKADADVEAANAFNGARLGVLHSVWTGAKAPASRLLTLLEKGWSDSGTLGDLARRIDGLSQQLSPETRFSAHVPGALAQLEIGGKP